ncbi:MAG TPA: efflux RND transporter periplasmic adaptor subunit, partial [Patescibacteria group bacterium]|nr:efflux RND transporter periplasmic adaptor subunit [Patescibacteria group bacterium]
KSAVSMARANAAAAAVSVNGAVEKVRAARAALAVARSEETLKSAAPAAEDVAAQEAVVRQAAAAVQAVQVQLAKTVLRSPLDGTVTRQDAKIGVLASPGMPVVSVISSGAFEIEVVIPESEIASIAPGAAASVALDAYGTGASFPAEVVSVDPSEVQAAGQTGYRAVLRFRSEDARIKDGMTADVEIDEGMRQDVIAVPRQAVITRDGTPFVLVVKDGATEQRKIDTGLVGSDGRIEVVSGLSEGDRIAGFGN